MSEMMIPVSGGEVWADSSGDGPPLILLHPGVGDSRIWAPILPALVETHRVIRYDARGFGHSPAPTVPYTLLDDLVTVLDHFGIDRAPIVGCSQGGNAAVALAITDPGRVSALVLLCPGISGYPWPDEPETDAAFEKAAEAGLDALAHFAGDLWAAAGPTPEVNEQLRSAAAGWMSSFEFGQENPPTFDRLGEIACPTSLLIGDLDRPSLIECNLRSAERIPGCELIQVPGVDHLPPLRVPALVLETIRTTLARVV